MRRDNALAQDFKTGTLLRFAAPSLFMMLFMGLYTMVDTLFIARLVNTDALAAVNIVCPVINLTVGLSAMLATGGNAILSCKMGQGRQAEANRDLTLLLLAGLTLGILLGLFGALFMEPLLRSLGASERLFPYGRDYLTVLLVFLPANMLQGLFQNLFVTAGKPGLGCVLSLAAGAANVVLDWVFMVPLQMGVRGAALGTGIGYLIPAAAGLMYFSGQKTGLSLARPRWDFRMLASCCANGSSEMVGQLAAAVTAFLFNREMMDRLGETGVASMTILIYSQFLLSTLFLGYGIGVAPVIGFNYGRRHDRLQKTVFHIGMGFVAAVSLLIFLAAWWGGRGIAALFADTGSAVYRLAVEGFSLFSCSFLFCGFNLYTSAMFTALSNGKVSAILSSLRTLVFVTIGLLLLPRLWGVTGIWLAVPLAELAAAILSAACLWRYRKRYGYAG